MQKDPFGAAPPEQQRPTPPQPAVDLFDHLFNLAGTPADFTPAHKPAGAAGRQVNRFANNPFAEEEEDMKSTSGREREMTARIELLEEKLAKLGEAFRVSVHVRYFSSHASSCLMLIQYSTCTSSSNAILNRQVGC